MMPRKPKPKPDEEFFEGPSPSEMDIEDFLTEWAPQTSVVEIYRRKEDGSQPHIKRVGMEILRADLYGYLRDKFGNGKYIMQFKDANRRIVKTLTVDVEGAPAVMVNGATGGGSFHEQLILTMIASMRPAPPPPPIDMGALMTGIAAMVGAMKPGPSTDPSAMLQAMALTFQQLKPAEGGGVKQALDLISAAKDLVPGGAAHEDTWPGLIKEGMGAVAQVFAARQQPNPPDNGNHRPAGIPPGAIPPGQLPAATIETQPAAAVEKTGDQLLQEWVTAQLRFLKMKARAGKDPAIWVDYTLDNAEEPGNAAILEAMRRGATFQHLLTFDAEIGKDPILAGWFQTYYEDLTAALNADLDSDGPGGDTENPGGDEASRRQ